MKISINRKSAFTLAEVLITLTIIGIVASLTIPALLNSTNDAELKAAWKKDYAVISQAYQMVKNENEFPYKFESDFITDFKKYLSYNKFCYHSQQDGCWHAINEWYTLAGIKITASTMDRSGMILNNGAYISTINYASGNCKIPVQSTALCFQILVDVNGKKPPNTVTKDIFGIDVHGNKIMPMGAPDSIYKYCDPFISNQDYYYSIACSAQALYQ